VRDRPSRTTIRAAALTGAFAGAIVVTAACGSDDSGDAERFCGEMQANVAAVVDPPLATVEDLATTLELYRDLADLAPAAIETEWDAIVLNVETVATVVPDDPASVQRAVAQAYATEKSAVTVREWLIANCGVDIGPVTTIAPQGRVSPPTSPPSSVPAAGG
jgi:hypothetical protein